MIVEYLDMNTSNTHFSSTIEEEIVDLATVEDLGDLLRAHRKARKLTIQNAAALAGCSIQFLHDLESGKPTIRMGLALKYARQLGLRIHASGSKLPAVQVKRPRSRTPGVTK